MEQPRFRGQGVGQPWLAAPSGARVLVALTSGFPGHDVQFGLPWHQRRLPSATASWWVLPRGCEGVWCVMPSAPRRRPFPPAPWRREPRPSGCMALGWPDAWLRWPPGVAQGIPVGLVVSPLQASPGPAGVVGMWVLPLWRFVGSGTEPLPTPYPPDRFGQGLGVGRGALRPRASGGSWVRRLRPIHPGTGTGGIGAVQQGLPVPLAQGVQAVQRTAADTRTPPVKPAAAALQTFCGSAGLIGMRFPPVA